MTAGFQDSFHSFLCVIHRVIKTPITKMTSVITNVDTITNVKKAVSEAF